ncbi:hypothetical protein KOR34_10990 [Posidoniimonas corsicana]|uniref:Uncharacterized protein n=1 Tax=Posidoniimonas corsicana TaxID=1938618 RepID=A0A5C5VC92_9BACT|nr:hypothetical protein [Posidoniimonas corsicana]TWT36198.1 hypothetical protein KOR34_10990 [Posidoniimonas corsicana]
MARGRDIDDSEVAGQDSFLDVVANIVGILILLVMVVGLRVSRETHAPTETTASQTPAVTSEEVAAAQQEAQKQYVLAAKAVDRARQSRAELQQQDEERVAVATLVAESKAELEDTKLKLSSDQRRDLELRTKLVAAQDELEELARTQVTLAAFKPQVESIESLPTPLAQTVSGDELHIRLADGHAAVIPLDQLLADFKEDAQANLWRLESREQASVSIGPIDGFRLVYTLRRANFTARSGASGTLIRLERWRLLPDATAQGEPVEQAVLPDSRLMRLVKARPATTTITVWTYPDSFNEFRTLKRALYELGYPTAGRPLPEGILIGGSPEGSQSAAQ